MKTITENNEKQKETIQNINWSNKQEGWEIYIALEQKTKKILTGSKEYNISKKDIIPETVAEICLHNYVLPNPMFQALIAWGFQIIYHLTHYRQTIKQMPQKQKQKPQVTQMLQKEKHIHTHHHHHCNLKTNHKTHFAQENHLIIISPFQNVDHAQLYKRDNFINYFLIQIFQDKCKEAILVQFACEMLPALTWEQLQYHPFVESEVLQLPWTKQEPSEEWFFGTNSSKSITEAHTYKQIDIHYWLTYWIFNFLITPAINMLFLFL